MRPCQLPDSDFWPSDSLIALSRQGSIVHLFMEKEERRVLVGYLGWITMKSGYFSQHWAFRVFFKYIPACFQVSLCLLTLLKLIPASMVRLLQVVFHRRFLRAKFSSGCLGLQSICQVADGVAKCASPHNSAALKTSTTIARLQHNYSSAEWLISQL